MISTIARMNAPHANSARSITGASDVRALVARGPGPTSQAPIAIRIPTDRATQPAAASESRDDVPGVARCWANRIVHDEVVDEVLPRGPAAQEDEHSDDGEPDPERAHLLAAAAPGEPDGADPAGDREDPDVVRDLLEPVRHGLRSVEVIGLDDRDLSGALGELCRVALDEPEAVAEPEHSGRRSRTTLPFEVSNARVSPWSTFTNWAWASEEIVDEGVLSPRPA